jgi:hypothetical protein
MNKVSCVSISNNNGPIDIMPLRSFLMMALHPLLENSSHSTASMVASDDTSEEFGEHIIKDDATEDFGEDIITSATTTAKKKKKKNVSFSASTSVRRTLCRNDITTEEKRAAWYYRAEYDQIKRQCSKQVQRIERGEILKDIKYCARGLEFLSRRAGQLKQKNLQAAYMAVLLDCHDHQQEHQIQQDDDDDPQISERYHSVSSSCQLWAITVGLRDQIAAEDYLFDVECCIWVGNFLTSGR